VSNTYLNIGGLWQKTTAKGSVLSCKLTDVTRTKLYQALESTTGGDLVIFENAKRDSDASPTHRLVVSVPMDQQVVKDSPVPKIVVDDGPLPF
jgi:hypothetical protein